MKDASIRYFHCSLGNPNVTYVSGTTVFGECLNDGRMIGLYWSAAGQVWEDHRLGWIPQSKAEIIRRHMHSFRLKVDGQSLDHGWIWADGVKRDDGGSRLVESTITLKNETRPVEAKIITTLDGTGFLARKMEITNLGSDSMAISEICPIAGELWDNTVKPELENGGLRFAMPFDWDTKTPYSLGLLDAKGAGEEGRFTFLPIDRECTIIENHARRPYGNPYFIVKNNVTGEMFFAALAWSAGYRAEIAYDRQRYNLSFCVGPSAPGALRVVAPGETVICPTVHIGPIHGSLDAAVESWYTHLRSSVIPQRTDKRKMFTVAAKMVEQTGDWILREVDVAAEMGAEVYSVDAGWYGKEHESWFNYTGDWFEGDFLPEGGLAAVREYIHKKGMLFGLWIAPEMASVKSKAVTEHPEWLFSYGGRSASPRNPGEYVLDLAKPEAAEFFKDSIFNVIEKYKPDVLKLDYGMSIYEGGINTCHGMVENQAWRHFETLYGVFDEVLKKNPAIVMENCANGGGRNDLGMLSRFHYAAESDWSVMPFSIRAINAMTLFIPPESMCYYHNHIPFANRIADLDTHLRVTLFAVPIFVGFGAQATDLDSIALEKTREYIELHKGFCRPVMANSPKVYHHTPFIGLQDHVPWCVLEYAAPDRSRGYAGVFRLGNNAEDNAYQLYLRGISIEKTYRVTSHNDKQSVTLSGFDLKQSGLRVFLEETNTSELYLYEELP